MDTAHMGLTSCRLITITGKLPRRRHGAQRHQPGCRAAAKRAADRCSLIRDGPGCFHTRARCIVQMSLGRTDASIFAAVGAFW